MHYVVNCLYLKPDYSMILQVPDTEGAFAHVHSDPAPCRFVPSAVVLALPSLSPG